MTSLGRSPLPMVTIVPFDVRSGQTINVNDFLRGLKRPAPLATLIPEAAFPTPDSHHDPVLIHDGVAPDSSMLDPPESCPTEIPWEDKDENSMPLAAESWTDEKPIDTGTEPMKAPKVVRTYTKKIIELVPFPAETQRYSSPLFCSQSFTQDDEQHSGLSPGEPETPNLKAITKDGRSLKASKQHRQWTELGGEQKSLQETVERQSEGETASDSDFAGKKQRKIIKERKNKRRAPVNEFALVPSLLTHLGSPAVKHKRPSKAAPTAVDRDYQEHVLDDLDLALLGEMEVFPVPAATNTRPSKSPKKANIGKPVTRMREEISLPQCQKLSLEGFKFPPATPKATKIPGWKLGSGFEGFNWETLASTRVPGAYRSKRQHTKCVRFRAPSSQALELSTVTSPSIQARTSRNTSKVGRSPTAPTNPERSGHADRRIPTRRTEIPAPIAALAEHDGEALFDQVRDLAALLLPPDITPGFEMSELSHELSASRHPTKKSKETTTKKGHKVHLAIRKPSKSERNGWLKRRRKVSFAVEADQDTWHQAEARVELPRPDELDGVPITDLQRSTTNQKRSDIWMDDRNPAECELGSRLHPSVDLEEDEEIMLDEPSTSYARQLCQTRRGVVCKRQLSPTQDASLSVLRVPSSCFQTVTSSRLEVQDSQEGKTDSSHMIKRGTGRLLQGLTKLSALEILLTSSEDTDHGSMATNQEWPESPDLGQYPYRIVPEADLSASEYFSKAIEQLSSPEKCPHSVAPRKFSHHSRAFPAPIGSERMPVAFSAQQGPHHVNVTPGTGFKRSQTEQGSLELGMTPRLKRTMSNVPFRPPFIDLS